MKTKERVVRILEDAEKAFRKKPDPILNNDLGLCRFFNHHKLIWQLDRNNATRCFELFSNNEFNNGFYHFSGFNQREMWKCNFSNTAKEERANWCANRLKQLRGE